MIKLSASTLGCPEWTFEQVVDNYERYGIEGVEIRGIDGEMEADKIVRFFPENLPKTLALMNTHGLKFVSFGTSVCLHAKENRDELVAYMARTIDVCARVGIPAIRVFGDQLPEEDGEKRDLILARIIGNLVAICDCARSKNVQIYLEIHGTVNCIRALRPIIEGVKHIPNFGIIWDVEHSDRTTGDDFTPFYKLIRPYIRHVHFKDYVRAKDNHPVHLTELGEGEIPLATIAKTLIAGGYEGYISLEWEKKWHPELSEPQEAFPKFVSYMKNIGVI